MANTRTRRNETLSDWKVVFLCTIIYFFQLGIVRTGSLFFVEFLNRFNFNRQIASIPFIICRILYVLSGPFFGFLGTYIQLRTVITFGSFISSFGLIACFWAEDIIFLSLFWGIFLGFGSGTALALLQEIINRHFDKHLSTAMGVYIAGASVGATVLPYITKILFDKYGLSGAFLIIGGLFLNTIPLSLALPLYPEIKNSSISDKYTQNINRQEEIQSEELDADKKIIAYTCHNYSQIAEERQKMANKKQLIFTLNRNCCTENESHLDVKRPNPKKTFNLSAFRIFLNPIFLALCTLMSCGATVFSMMNTIFIDYCLEKGLTPDQSVYAFMILSATDLLGRIGLGWITDCGYVEAVKFVGISYVVVGLTCLIYSWSNSFFICVAASLAYGTFFGVVESYSPKLLKDYIEPSERTMAVASRRIFYVPICGSSPFIFGYFKDTVKSYDGLMYVLAATSFLVAVISFFLPIMVKQRQKSPVSVEQRF